MYVINKVFSTASFHQGSLIVTSLHSVVSVLQYNLVRQELKSA